MKKYGKHTILGWSWRTLLGVVLTPFVLFALLALLIYCPPVQKWAVDKAADWLSNEMGMEVSVENVRLKFPLDLSMGGMLAIQEGDTVLNAEELRLSVQVRPLFDKQINVDDIILRNADVNTRELIDAILIKGHIGRFEAYTHGLNLNDELVTVNKLNLTDSRVLLALPDTVPPDTTESEPTKWKLDFQDINLKKVNFSLALAQDKNYSVKELHELKSITPYIDSYLYDAKCRALVDLGNSIYTVNDLKVKNSTARVDEAVNLKDVNLTCDSLRYADKMNLYVGINRLSGSEVCGLNFKEVSGIVRMDSLNLYLDGLNVLTDDSKMNINMNMALNTWSDENPGIMQLDLNSILGKSDVMSITHYVDRFLAKDAQLGNVRDLVQEYMPTTPTPLKVSVIGNLNDLQFNDIHTKIKGVGTLEGSARMRGDIISTKLRANLLGGDAVASGSYNMNDESYDIDLILNNFNVNKYVDVGERTRLTGKVHAKGKGFDFYSPKTCTDAVISITKGNYGKVNLSSVNATASLKKSQLDVHATCNNNQLKTSFCLAGVLKKGIVDGSLDIELPFADIKAMGYSDSTLTVKTRGQMDFYSNLSNIFKIDSYMNGLNLVMGHDTINTADFDLFAETTRDSTVANLVTGDLTFDFGSPYNMFTLIKKWNRMQSVADRQFRSRDVNLDKLKQYFPKASLSATAGTDNPLISILKTEGIRFDRVQINLDSSPETGVTGNGQLYALSYDSIRIDTAYFDIHQDSSRIAFNSGVKFNDKQDFPASKARIDGYYGLTDADIHLQVFDREGEEGIDLGAHFVDQDSVFHTTLYPEQPIIGYRQFAINDDNYIDFYKQKNHPIVGYIQLTSAEDNADISLTGIDFEGNQRALVEINNLDLGELTKAIPFAPDMDGKFSIDAAYKETDEKFWVDGTIDIGNFVYEDMNVGNVGASFTYEPGEDFKIHNVEGDISYEGFDVASLNGSYDTTGDGYLNADLTLNELPVKMFSAFVPDQIVNLDGILQGAMSVKGPTDKLQINGYAVTDSVTVTSPYYSVNLRLQDDTIRVNDSKITFDKFNIYGADENHLTLDGSVDFGNTDNILYNLTLMGKDVQLVKSQRTLKSILFGNAYGDIYAKVSGGTDDIDVRGYINILPKTDVTYIMDGTAISQGDRLEDIVTFVNFALPPDSSVIRGHAAIMGVDMKMTVNVEDGAKFRAEFSADKQSYVDVRCGGQLRMVYTPEGVMNVQGKLTVNDGEMKYQLPIIPLKTFTLQSGSYVEFTGDLYNPSLNITATERTKAQVSSNGSSSRSVNFDVGLVISQTLNNMGFAFTLTAPDDAEIQSDLSNYSDEEKYKLAIALLATGMYMADNNSSAITANNALSSFLQQQINTLTNRALNNIIDVNIGMDQQTYSDGSTGNDYTFKFSKRFFSDRLSIVIGGRVSDNQEWNKKSTVGSFIDDVSLEWRLDNSATRYVRIFHRRDYDNIVEGVLEKNGAGIVLRKKLSNISDIIFWKKNKEASPARAEEKRKESATQSPKGESGNAQDERKEDTK